MLLLFYCKFHVINPIHVCNSHDVRGGIGTNGKRFLFFLFYYSRLGLYQYDEKVFKHALQMNQRTN